MVALGGAIGAVARYQVGRYSQQHFTGDYPVATLLVNVLGSFFFGLVFYFLVEKAHFSASFNESLRLLVLVGLLGAFTTFSTFSFELFVMIQKGQWMYAIASVLANVLLSFAALATAYYASKHFFS